MQNSSSHIPVMMNEVLQYLSPKSGEVYVDATFGAGGYSEAILNSADCKIIAIDKDPSVRCFFDKLEQKYPGRIALLQGSFADIKYLLEQNNTPKVDGVVFDLGVSSMQIDQGERGFSFMKDGPLDMRMSQEGRSAAELINKEKEEVIANKIFAYGDERKSRRIASAICRARAEKEINTTSELAKIVRSALPGYGGKIDPATRTFQAIRIWVNDELGDLEQALESLGSVLNEGGRVVVVTFHSLEDQIVKKFLQDKSGKSSAVSRHLPFVDEKAVKEFNLFPKGAVKPSDSEVKNNPRARSAKLRSAIKAGDKGNYDE